MFIFKLLIVDQTDTLFRHPGLEPGGSLPGIEHPLDRRYADGMTLMGYEQDRETMAADDLLRIDLYLSAYARPNARYMSVVHLVGPDGLRWSPRDSANPRGYADYPFTTIWSPGVYALDSHEIEPLPGTPPGTYDIVLTVFDMDTLAPLSVLNEQGQPAAPELTLGQIALTRPPRPTVLPQDKDRLDLPVGDLTLLTAEMDRDQARPGDPVLLVTHWRAEEQPAEDMDATLTLLAGGGSRAAEFAFPPAAAWHPASAWQAGDVWRGQHVLRLPAGLASGTYTWTIGLPGTSAHPIAWLSVTAPEHVFDPPQLAHTRTSALGTFATLTGFELGSESVQPGETLSVTLAWRVEETPATSYHVFLHLIDPDGSLRAQSDAVPAGWNRPTTGWVPGEYIVDTHTLTIPPDAPTGTYTLLAGLYEPTTGQRLTDPAGKDAVPLITIDVGEE